MNYCPICDSEMPEYQFVCVECESLDEMNENNYNFGNSENEDED